jgi:hypothetical protein
MPFHERYESDLFIDMSEYNKSELDFLTRTNEHFKKKSATALIDIFPRDEKGESQRRHLVFGNLKPYT